MKNLLASPNKLTRRRQARRKKHTQPLLVVGKHYLAKEFKHLNTPTHAHSGKHKHIRFNYLPQGSQKTRSKQTNKQTHIHVHIYYVRLMPKICI